MKKRPALDKMREGVQAEGLLDLISGLPTGLVMAEIGCWIGESALLFLDSGKIKQYYAVDVWRNLVSEGCFDLNMKDRDIVKLKMPMCKAIPYLPKLDFVYIDGDHSYRISKRDIEDSLKVLKKGGIIAGHDYSPKYEGRVVKAVDEVLGKPHKVYKDTSWLVQL